MANDLDSVTTDYLDNADYDTAGSVTKCKAFITACRKLLLLIPDSSSHNDDGGGQSIEHSTIKLENEMKNAIEWLSVNETTTDGGSTDTIYLSAEYFRG